MATKLGIVNMAISHLGIGKEVADFDAEKSQEAACARRFYDTALDTILSDADWSFATKIQALALIETEPNTEWAFSYRYPSDCVSFRRVLSGIRNDTQDTVARYKLAQDSAGRIIYADEEDAQAEYGIRADNPAFYPSDFALAFSYLMAGLMAPRLTAGDPFKLGARAWQMYGTLVSMAKARSANEQRPDESPDAESIRARN